MGLAIPITILHQAGANKSGELPTLLYGYGGFGLNLTPVFDPNFLTWIDMGGAIAIPNIRGGGEYGELWHQSGMRAQKQNSFDDFAAAADWLVAKGYTVPKRLGIYGRSNGGTLVGAAITQHPEKYGAAVVGVGVLDVLCYTEFTAGWLWVDEFGDPNNARGCTCD